MTDKNIDDFPMMIVDDTYVPEVTVNDQGEISVGPLTMATKSPTHLPPDEYAHLPVVVYKDGKRIVIGEAILSGSEIQATVNDSALAREIIGHAFRTDEISLGPIGIPRPRRKSMPGNPRARFDNPQNIMPKGVYGKRGK